MHKTRFTKFLQSFVSIPILVVAIPLIGVSPTVNMVADTISFEENSVITTQEEVSKENKALAIDNFFTSYNAPLAGYGMKFVEEAEKNDIDWRLLPAIAMRETTGGKQACKNPKAPNNNFGWFSCKKGFSSVDESIEYISMTLGGNNKNAPHYRSDMTSDQILKKYNPDYIVPGYSKQVIRIMKMIDSSEAVI